MSILDDYPYPAADKHGQELIRVLATLYSRRKEALRLTEPMGIRGSDLTPDMMPNNMWLELLQMLASKGKVRQTAEIAVEQFPKNPRTAFLRDLLADLEAPVSAEPANDAADFDDTVSEHEALLFFDDLTMPVGSIPTLIETLKRLQAVSPSVCLLRTANVFGSFYGTGFRISPDLVLTNHHVLFPEGTTATKVIADFGFDLDASGHSTAITSLDGDVPSIMGEKTDDWATIKVSGMKADWQILDLTALPVPKVGDPAFVIQHPGGQQKRLGYVRNTISDVDERYVRYLTDTQPGSSGAPVFDSSARLIALHHAGGQPVEVAGRPPVAKNEGMRMSRIVERLKKSKIMD